MYNPSFTPVRLTEELTISELYTIHYFEYMNDFSFPGESHDFWEFLCVDKGAVQVQAGNITYSLKKGDIIFHQPNEFHSVVADGKIAPNLVVVSFSYHSPLMDFFRGRILQITESDRTLLGLIIQEARQCFKTPLDDPYVTQMERMDKNAPASEQLIRLYLEQLLLLIIRRYSTSSEIAVPLPVKSTKKKNDSRLYEQVLLYMEEHLQSHLSIEDICRDNMIGRSQLQKLFRSHHECGVIDYFSKMKIDAARVYIREQSMNFSQIADYLGYTSVHYFSRQFKKITGMTPSDYASSIKVLSEEPGR